MKNKSGSKEFKRELDFQKFAKKDLEETFGSDIWVLIPYAISRRGIPDMLICLRGHFVALELKLDGSKKDKTRESLQKHVIGKIKEAGSLVAHERVTPSKWEAVKQALGHLA